MRQSFFFLFFFILISNYSSAKENKSINKLSGCLYKVTKDRFYKIDQLPIKLIEVDTHDYRRWTVNSLRILTTRYRFVEEKYKKRFNATIAVTFKDNSKCIFEGRIRHSGDEKDHIALLDNSISQSIDVHLDNGNIKGITKFKLLRSNTRGNLEDEIFLTEILRNINFIAPRTSKVSVRINKITTQMIFQEKAAKEMLEFNNRREGPILEGDERFFRKLVEKFEDNNLSNWSAGIVPLMDRSVKYMLSKQVNANIVEKSPGHEKMSLNANSYLNLVYLYFSNRFQDKKNKYHYFEYDLDNTLLGFFSADKISLLNQYNLLMQATNSTHGLAINNRKFYWNSLENYFEPINYDSNSNISLNVQPGIFRLPIDTNVNEDIDFLIKKLKKIDIEKVSKNLKNSGLNLSKNKIKIKLDQIFKNLDQIKFNYDNYVNEDMIEHNRFQNIENVLTVFHTNLKDSHPNTRLIKNNSKNKIFEKCEVFLENCISTNFSTKELSKLLEGDLRDDKAFVQYIGKAQNLENLYDNNLKKNFRLNETDIFYEKGIIFDVNKSSKTIDIKQVESGAKIYFINGSLDDFKINYSGYLEENKNQIPKDFPINSAGLTGCLSFINMQISKIEINANNSTCEDTVNFINVSGDIKYINIQNSYRDALDIDFSNLDIKNININLALNDCVDFSYGNYKIDQLNLINCGDKAVSVGEKSKLKMTKIFAKESKFGIASKDSSIVELELASFDNLNTCLAAYKKKQEFEGGIIEVKNMNCSFSDKEIISDEHSKITLQNKI